MKKSNAGRPSKMVGAVIVKLEQAFAMGMNDTDACFYAEIDPSTFYRYKDAHPEFCNKIQRLKTKPVMKAYSVVNNALDGGDVSTAKWLLERKRKDDFAPRSEIVQPEPVKVYITPEQQAATIEHINLVINSGS